MVDGRKHVRRGVHRPMAEWDVLIKDHHEAYISWDEFERNLKAIASNATGRAAHSPAVQPAKASCCWLGLRGGHCGRKLHVHYGGSSAATTATVRA